MKARQSSVTGANSASSRSHALITIVLEQGEDKSRTTSRFNIVDLAGESITVLGRN